MIKRLLIMKQVCKKESFLWLCSLLEQNAVFADSVGNSRKPD